ncbi:MAG: hypothetical protein Q9199_007854 [Rusavskia elegans]
MSSTKIPTSCCGKSGNQGCVCASQAKCSCGKQSALNCTCEKASTENTVAGARCSCRMSLMLAAVRKLPMVASFLLRSISPPRLPEPEELPHCAPKLRMFPVELHDRMALGGVETKMGRRKGIFDTGGREFGGHLYL